MLKKDNFVIGLLAGMVLPVITWIIFGCLFIHAIMLDKPLIPYFVAIALNLLLIRLCFAKNAAKIGTGIITSTFIAMLLLVLFKSHFLT